MKAYAPGEQINDATKLNTNECAWGPAPGVLKAVAQTTVDMLRLYPSPMADRVRAAAADVFEIDASSVLVGNGSDDCLTIVMRSFLGPGDVVACPWPTYSLYDTLATIQGVEIKHAEWSASPDPLLRISSHFFLITHLSTIQRVTLRITRCSNKQIICSCIRRNMVQSRSSRVGSPIGALARLSRVVARLR